MSFKTTLAAAALTLGTAFANAQSFDMEKEASENLAGAKAIQCSRISRFLFDDVLTDAKKASIKVMQRRAMVSGINAYDGSIEVFLAKSKAGAFELSRDMAIIKAHDVPAYENTKASFFKQLDNCIAAYPVDLQLNLK